jgi:hypothetical protein
LSKTAVDTRCTRFSDHRSPPRAIATSCPTSSINLIGTVSATSLHQLARGARLFTHLFVYWHDATRSMHADSKRRSAVVRECLLEWRCERREGSTLTLVCRKRPRLWPRSGHRKVPLCAALLPASGAEPYFGARGRHPPRIDPLRGIQQLQVSLAISPPAERVTGRPVANWSGLGRSDEALPPSLVSGNSATGRSPGCPYKKIERHDDTR